MNHETPTTSPPPAWSIAVAKKVTRYAWLIVLAGALLLYLAIQSASGLKVSTKLEALMPEGAESVITLQRAMEKAGSFSSIQVIFRAEEKAILPDALEKTSERLRALNWVHSVQYYEDLSLLERHKLLLLDEQQLRSVEQRIEQEVVSQLAKAISKKTGMSVNLTLHDRGISSKKSETAALEPQEPLNEDIDIDTQKDFSSDDGLSYAIVVWPKSGNEGLDIAKTMVEDVAEVINDLQFVNTPSLQVGIAGRIKNKVAQYDAVLNDVVVGLGSSVALILLVLVLSYRRFIAIPVIVIPLVVGIVWTIGLTALTVGGLNLITIFLALILFGLGIDFGIHNFSRYLEARGHGEDHTTALARVFGCTGVASLFAALTTAASFLALTFTQFRAFQEFGLIAGTGILLIFISMYTLFPAIISILKTFIKADAPSYDTDNSFTKKIAVLLTSPSRMKGMFAFTALLLIFAGFYAPQLKFEKNFKNIQAERSKEHKWATSQSKEIFKGGHDRAILVVDTLDEVKAIEKYFEAYIANDTETPTVSKITSILNLVPNQQAQERRLEIINDMKEWVEDMGVPDEMLEQAKYLDIEAFDKNDLPTGLKRTFLGNENLPGYLMYIYNSVTMDDADLARQFYDDAAHFEVNGKVYHPASEGFIFVEMIALMKLDAIKAIALVLLTTFGVLLLFSRSITGTIVMILPPVFGLLITVALMAVFDIKLSIINMVILPSIIGISVDNSIHLYERFRETKKDRSVPRIMRTTGVATTITTLTTLLGFSGLLLASMGGLQSMGLVAVIGFGTCLLLTWTFFPAVLNLIQTYSNRE